LHGKIGAGLGVVSLLESLCHKCIADATTAEQRVSTTEPGGAGPENEIVRYSIAANVDITACVGSCVYDIVQRT